MHLFAACMHSFRDEHRKYQHEKPFSCSPPLKGPLLWKFCYDCCMWMRKYVRGEYTLPATLENKAHWEGQSRERWSLLILDFVVSLGYKRICKHSYSGEICKWDIIHWKAVACEESFIFTNRCFWKFYLANRSFYNLHANWLSSTLSTWRHANHPSSESPGSAGLRSATGLKSKLAHWNCGLLCSEH